MQEVNNKLLPLQQWICDCCGEVIEKATDGWLEWYRDIADENLPRKSKGFRIVHHDKRCMYNERDLSNEGKLTGDMHLDAFIGADGLVKLLSKIQFDYAEDNAELVEIIRRLHVPYYEEARLYHSVAEQNGDFDGENELTRYLTQTSINILNEYK